ncbi:MAG: winged helix-turn-helix transcriptional regulator [Clostridia bacterium]|nr:winged helix-turn-helix transcriptional regulator [Clostridia bacterium]
MSLPVYVFSEDEYLFLKIRVLCEKEGWTPYRITKEEATLPLLVWDIDTSEGQKVFPALSHDKVILLSRDDIGNTARLPITNKSLLALLRGAEEGAPLTLDHAHRVAHIYGETIKLTELEGELLSYLISRGGECATNEELCAHLWGGQASASAVNVYIHYLREKLELRGEKVILVRRGKGYYIEPKFLKGGRTC